MLGVLEGTGELTGLFTVLPVGSYMFVCVLTSSESIPAQGYELHESKGLPVLGTTVSPGLWECPAPSQALSA